MKKALLVGSIATLGATASMASAQTIIPEGYTAVPVEFSGYVTSSISGSVVIKNPDGSFSPYTGPVPDYDFDAGDPISIGFTAIVPSGEGIANGIVPESADGIYRFQVGPRPEQLGDFPGTGSFVDIKGSAGIEGTGQYGTDGRLFMVYDANTGEYLIDPAEPLAGGDSFGLGFFDMPVLTYDAATGVLGTSQYSDLGLGGPGYAWSGTGNDAGRIPAGIFNFDGLEVLGTSALSDITFDGAWNLPVFNGPSDPTPVPAPPMTILFGLAAGLIFRRKMQRKVA